MTRRPRPPAPPVTQSLKRARPPAPVPVTKVVPVTLEQHPRELPAPDTRLLDHLRLENDLLKAKASRLENELNESRIHARLVEESVLNIRNDQLDRAREQGHGEVLSELEALWRSEHFCTELLYGSTIKRVEIHLR